MRVILYTNSPPASDQFGFIPRGLLTLTLHLMKNNIIVAILVLTVLGLAGACLYQSEKIKKYSAYYDATESLLDTLENRYNWVDCIDSQDYYDAVDKLN